MHSLAHRSNSLLTFFGSTAAVLCALTAVTDVFHKASPKINVTLDEVKKLTVSHGGKDQAVINFSIDADLRSSFSWNTKQLFVYLQAEYVTKENKLNHVVLWDAIIQQKEKAVIKLRRHKTKYAFLDQFKGLRGAELNLSLCWDVMPRVGYFYTQCKPTSVGTLPSSYTS